METGERNQNGRIIAFDIIKIMASLMIIIYHFYDVIVHSFGQKLGFVPEQFYIPNFNKVCLGFCAMSVPLFFMVNGALMLGKDREFKYYLKKAVKTAMLYVLWMIIIKGFSALMFKTGVFNTMRIGPLTTHLWFLRTLAVLYISGYVLTRFYDNKVVMGIICGFLAVFPFAYNYVVPLGKIINISFFENLDRTGFFTLYAVLYYVMGKFLFHRIRSFHQKKYFYIVEIGLIVLGCLMLNGEVVVWTELNNWVFDGVNTSFPTFGAMFMATGAFSLICRIGDIKSDKIKNVINFLSSNIMGVYLIHPLILACIKMITSGGMNIFQVTGIAICTMLLAATITWGIKKIPIVKKLFEI